MFDDPILQKLIKKYPKPHFQDRSAFLFERLIESIISQQLSVKASDTIYSRFLKLFEPKKHPDYADLMRIPGDLLRTTGISYPKISYIKSLAQTFQDKQIDIAEIKKLSDEAVIETLIKLKGVGKWTAEMMLIFTFNRPDVFSIGDAGLRRAMTNLYKIKDTEEMLKLSETWKPYRSTASWYLWRSLENIRS